MESKYLASVIGVLVFVAVGHAVPRPPNCAAVQCGIPICNDNEILETQPGDCCPSCVRKSPINCALVRCALPVCENGREPYTPAGQCCPVCSRGKIYPYN